MRPLRRGKGRQRPWTVPRDPPMAKGTSRVSLPNRPGPHQGNERRPKGRASRRSSRLKSRHPKYLKMGGQMLRKWKDLYLVSGADLNKLNHASLLLQRKAQRGRMDKVHRRSVYNPRLTFMAYQRQIHNQRTDFHPGLSPKRRFYLKPRRSLQWAPSVPVCPLPKYPTLPAPYAERHALRTMQSRANV